MKKHLTLVVMYLMGGAEENWSNSAYDQLLAHQDIEYTYIPEPGSAEDPYKVIIPYHAVNFAVITHEVETVEAPVDSICEEA